MPSRPPKPQMGRQRFPAVGAAICGGTTTKRSVAKLKATQARVQQRAQQRGPPSGSVTTPSTSSRNVVSTEQMVVRLLGMCTMPFLSTYVCGGPSSQPQSIRAPRNGRRGLGTLGRRRHPSRGTSSAASIGASQDRGGIGRVLRSVSCGTAFVNRRRFGQATSSMHFDHITKARRKRMMRRWRHRHHYHRRHSTKSS